MSNEFKTKEKMIEKMIEEKSGSSMDVLKMNRCAIKERYDSKFSTMAINGTSNFVSIYCAVYSKERKEINSLAEKCIKRASKIESLGFLFQQDDFIKEEIIKANLLWYIIQSEIIPLEILWGMEKKQNENVSLNANEQSVCEYLKSFARFYLKQTEGLLKKLNHKRITTLKETGYQLSLHSSI